MGDEHEEVHADRQARETAVGHAGFKKHSGRYLNAVTWISCFNFEPTS